jgi:Transposase IS4
VVKIRPVYLDEYAPAVQLGQTGMSRERFDVLLSSLPFTHQPDTRPSSCSSEDYRWMLVNDFVQNFNAHRAQRFSPSDRIFVDESMS